ncbi:MAG TPA: FHA domain-containing protein [Pyrinomonadaceae bacterium]
MTKATLHIENSYERRDFELEDDVTIGRSDASALVLSDQGLSRRNTTVFRDGEAVLVVDEGSLNGTFLNGVRLTGPAAELRNGDELKIGSETRIRVQIGGTVVPVSSAKQPVEPPRQTSLPSKTSAASKAAPPAGASGRPPLILIAAGLLTVLIILFAALAYFIASRYQSGSTTVGSKTSPPISSTAVIPVRVVDPLGGEDEDDLDDLIASWEVSEKEINADSVGDVKVDPTDTADSDLNVTAAFLADRQKKALEQRNGEVGIRPAGLDVPKELFGDGVIKQKAKLKEMNSTGYQQPMDFGDLAAKRLKGDLIEMPMAAKSFYLDVGGSASDGPFSSFSFQSGAAEIPVGSPKYQALSQLASNFSGQKYDLNNPADRKQIRMRLLRMFNKRAKPILQELAEAYFGKFGRPLRVTSLTRSMDYQIGLNSGNPNSFKVRGEGSLPPHTSGCAFDLARKHMTAEEQNFIMKKLAEMEDANKLDALIEYGVNACFHIFIYYDGVPPKQ